MQIKTILLNITIATVAFFGMNGCSAMQETLASQAEVPTLEKQANRVAVGMAIVKENNIIENKLAISADAKWPKIVSSDINDTKKGFINQALMADPYYSTKHYTESIQRKMLGSGALLNSLGDYGNTVGALLNQSVSPLDYVAFNKIDIFFANPDLQAKSSYKNEAEYIKARTKNWPDIFKFNLSLSDMLDFEDGNLTEIDSPSGDVYENLHKALISLAPVNLKKDIGLAQNEYQEATQKSAELEAQKGALENEIESGKSSESGDELSDEQKESLEQELALIEEGFKSAKSDTKEKEKIYFELLDQMAIALEGDPNIDDENYVKLAKNINLAANELQVSSTEAYTAFGLALAQLSANKALVNFPKELESLSIAKSRIPLHLMNKFDARMARLVKNALAILPNIALGSYYAYQQASIGGKYENITNKILEAYKIKKEQDKAAIEAENEATDEEQE